MIPSTLPRASKLARPADRTLGRSQRPKSFIRRLDKNNDVYYTLAKNRLGSDPDPDKQYEFFQMPNLVLDLDADGARYVRTVEDEDDAALMKAKWAAAPRREAVKARLKQLEAQVHESRTRAHAILSQPTNVWRITPHDVLSAALHGGSGFQKTTTASPRLGEQETDSGQEEERAPSIGPTQRIDKIRVENGIPPHAANDDQLLLHWIMLRYKSLQRHSSSTTTAKAAPSSSKIKQALEAQSCVTGIRRLVFQCLAAGTDVSSFRAKAKTDVDLPREIRNACELVLRKSTTTDNNPRIEILTFLGNLSERLVPLGAHLGTLLCGLALQLAARIGSLEATSVWLHRCYNTLPSSPAQEAVPFLEDILSTLDSLEVILRSDDGSLKMDHAGQRQLLFQLLTGLDENNRLSPDSMRSFLTLLRGQNTSDAAELQRQLYAGYLAILGHLGAVRTIWKEWRHLVPYDANTSVSEKDDGIALAFGAAIRRAAVAMPRSNDELAAHASLEECATADYHAIERQELHSWQGRTSDDAKKYTQVGCWGKLEGADGMIRWKQIRSTHLHPEAGCCLGIPNWGGGGARKER